MKRFYTTLLMMVVALGMMAQGWPEKYNGVMLQAFYWDGFAETTSTGSLATTIARLGQRQNCAL